jgi:hypothetical protein
VVYKVATVQAFFGAYLFNRDKIYRLDFELGYESKSEPILGLSLFLGLQPLM